MFAYLCVHVFVFGNCLACLIICFATCVTAEHLDVSLCLWTFYFTCGYLGLGLVQVQKFVDLLLYLWISWLRTSSSSKVCGPFTLLVDILA